GAPVSLALTAFDRFGDQVVGYRGTIHFTSSDAGAVLPPDYTFTAADQGEHTFELTLETLGTQTVTATDTAGIVKVHSLVLVLGPPDHLTIEGPGVTTPGKRFSVTVTAPL